MKVIFGIAILTAKDIDALNARIDAVERATGRNEYLRFASEDYR